jgi:hypothetical protein
MRLGDQCEGNEVIFGNTLAPLNDHTMDSPGEFHSYSTALVQMLFYQHPNDTQVLCIFRFRQLNSSPEIQFFVGSQWVRDTVVHTSTEKTAHLVDVPPRVSALVPSSVYISARVAGNPSNFVAFTGFEAFLL